jgi:hypothetical protein
MHSGEPVPILIVLVVEGLRRPKLVLSIANPLLVSVGAGQGKSLRIDVYNKPLLWAMSRAPGLQCRGEITFYHLDGQDRFGKPMAARWSDSIQPGPIRGVLPDGQEFQIQDPERLTLESRMDIFPGEHKDLDVVIRFSEDQDCYGWNNETYFRSTDGRHPDWKLEHNRYLVKVMITSSGQKFLDVFRLVNDVPYNSFRLDPATPEDRRLLGCEGWGRRLLNACSALLQRARSIWSR